MSCHILQPLLPDQEATALIHPATDAASKNAAQQLQRQLGTLLRTGQRIHTIITNELTKRQIRVKALAGSQLTLTLVQPDVFTVIHRASVQAKMV